MTMFFKKTSLSIDISDFSIEVICLEGPINSPRLLALGRAKLTEGIVEDGQILDRKALEKSLKEVIEKPKFGRIGTKKLIFSLPESKSFIHRFQLPANLPKGQIPEYLSSQARENFPYQLENLYFDYQEALLVAAPKRIVNDYLEIFKSCHLKPQALEIESLSLARALLADSKEPVLIADIGARTTNLNIFDGGELKLSFSVPIAGNKFSQAVSEKLNIPLERAENLKKEIGLNPVIGEGKVFLILQKELQGIVEEIKKIKGYFQDKTGKSIEKMVLAGGSSALPNLGKYLAENLGITVEIGDPWLKINIDILKRKESFEKALEINPILYSTAIGAALRGLDKRPEKSGINLLPKT